MDRIELKKAIVFVVIVAVLGSLAVAADEPPARNGMRRPRFGRGVAADPNNTAPEEPVRRRGLGRNRGTEQPVTPNAPDETNVPDRGGRRRGFGRDGIRRQPQAEQQQQRPRQGRRGIGAERFGRGLNSDRNIPDGRGIGARQGQGNRVGRGRGRREGVARWQNQRPGEDRRGLGQRRLERGIGRRQYLNEKQGRGPVGPRAGRDEYGQRPGWRRGRGRGANEDATSAPTGQRGQRRGRWQDSPTPDQFQENTYRERVQKRIRTFRRLGQGLKQRMRDWQ